MAWSEAARRASALVRRRLAEAKGRFHEYGTPKFSEFHVTQKYRTDIARRLRDIRSRARSGVSLTSSDYSDIDSAATASGMARHPTHPIRMTRLMTPDYAASTRAKYHSSGKEQPVRKAPASASRGRKSTAAEKRNRARSLKIFRQNRGY